MTVTASLNGTVTLTTSPAFKVDAVIPVALAMLIVETVGGIVSVHSPIAIPDTATAVVEVEIDTAPNVKVVAPLCLNKAEPSLKAIVMY